VSDIREDRPGLSQITKANFFEDVSTRGGTMEKPGHEAPIDGLVGKLPAAASNMSLLELASDRPSNQSSVTLEQTPSNGIAYSGFDSLKGAWHCADLSGTRDVTGLNLYLLTPADWRVLREARLTALLDSPQAFTSSYADEAVWGESEWRRGFKTARWIVAHETGKVIGLARSVIEEESPSTRHLESIWVAPTHRRRGVCRALLRALVEMELSMGMTELMLWVLEENHAAWGAYTALGFEPTGERQFLPGFGRFERRLRFVLTPLQESKSAARGFELHRNGTKLGQRPGFQLKEGHSFTGAAQTIDAV
jgi:ribosomal protein S18 acetylase RimI-like enzyme